MKKVRVESPSKSYDVWIGAGLLDKLEELDGFDKIIAGRALYGVTDCNVGALHRESLERAIGGRGGRFAGWTELEPGEEHKSIGALEPIWDGLIEAGLERRDLLVALGGGVVGDIAGFGAASYLRGIDFIQVPTTLLAMVDSSVGGKTAVDHARGKNLIGAFHQPSAVVADLSLLRTLDRRQKLSGLAEVVKAAILEDPELFELLEKTGPGLVEDENLLEEAVARAVAIKARIVAADERESGQRALLNLGHTLGHAIETAAGYAGYTHGEGVAMGLAFSASLSVSKGMMNPRDAERIERLLAEWNYPLKPAGLSADKILEALEHDKKSSGGEVRWVLAERIGKAVWNQKVEQNLLKRLLMEFLEV